MKIKFNLLNWRLSQRIVGLHYLVCRHLGLLPSNHYSESPQWLKNLTIIDFRLNLLPANSLSAAISYLYLKPRRIRDYFNLQAVTLV